MQPRVYIPNIIRYRHIHGRQKIRYFLRVLDQQSLQLADLLSNQPVNIIQCPHNNCATTTVFSTAGHKLVKVVVGEPLPDPLIVQRLTNQVKRLTAFLSRNTNNSAVGCRSFKRQPRPPHCVYNVATSTRTFRSGKQLTLNADAGTYRFIPLLRIPHRKLPCSFNIVERGNQHPLQEHLSGNCGTGLIPQTTINSASIQNSNLLWVTKLQPPDLILQFVLLRQQPLYFIELAGSLLARHFQALPFGALRPPQSNLVVNPSNLCLHGFQLADSDNEFFLLHNQRSVHFISNRLSGDDFPCRRLLHPYRCLNLCTPVQTCRPLIIRSLLDPIQQFFTCLVRPNQLDTQRTGCVHNLHRRQLNSRYPPIRQNTLRPENLLNVYLTRTLRQRLRIRRQYLKEVTIEQAVVDAMPIHNVQYLLRNVTCL